METAFDMKDIGWRLITPILNKCICVKEREGGSIRQIVELNKESDSYREILFIYAESASQHKLSHSPH